MSELAVYAACEGMARPEGNGWCRRCGVETPGRSWCSQACADWWLDNHEWGSAKAAAKRRDGNRCVVCGHPGSYVDGVVNLVAFLTATDPAGLCLLLEHGEAACQLAVVVRLARRHSLQPRWASLTECNEAAEGLTAQDELAAQFRRYTHHNRLEVNHIVPRRGKGYGTGCWNHLENLEVLCHPCHLEETAVQAAASKDHAPA